MNVQATQGGNYCQLSFKDFPKIVEVQPGQDDSSTFREKYEVTLPREMEIRGVDFFYGHDRGDRTEFDVTVYAGDSSGGFPYFVARRIEEKEDDGTREANRVVPVLVPVSAKRLRIYVTCRVTGESLIDEAAHPSHASKPGWRAVFDLNLTLIGRVA